MVHNILYYIVKEILKRTLVRMLICCVIALLFCITGNAKVPYIPKIINYSVSDYKAGNQNWAVSQGPGGKMYIGNNRGLLVFDGIHWDLVKLPNNLGVRALYISKDGRIYVGSFEEFGSLQFNGIKLENRVEIVELKSCGFIHIFFSADFKSLFFYADGSLIAVIYRIFKKSAVLVEKTEINAPCVDADAFDIPVSCGNAF